MKDPLFIPYVDITITCRDCRASFVHTPREQALFDERGWSEPSRCGECRAARRADRADRGIFRNPSHGQGIK